ncbi:MAG: 2,3-bisphosphoglycerate-independent phosphoglycerate mutase [Legionellaceae bacterium]|nr:2,3-bisphosphoglycerate-independent phosphoglycerate mutase [Legionellaceae bacterium]
MKKLKPIVLIILDGWGYQPQDAHNAISQANTPTWDHWWQSMPHMLLDASGESVGLPSGQMGNSEVGHMHIGAGRVIAQDYTRINQAIAQHELPNNPVLQHLIRRLQTSGAALHLAGLVSTGGVHSHEAHLFALIDLLAPKLSSPVYLHCFLDGRDCPPQSARESLQRLAEKIQAYPHVHIQSLSGRYYAMDRDQRWERIAKAYDCIAHAHSEHCFAQPEDAIAYFYHHQIYDEFIVPSQIGTPHPVRDGDSFLFFNFRSDRARQLTQAFIDPDFDRFNNHKRPKLAEFVSMTQYSDALPCTVLFPPQILEHTLGQILAEQGLSQLRIAETEKYAHVTFFFNGGAEQVFPNEDRVLIASPKVSTYDLQPEMSAPELTAALQEAIDSAAYDVIICNYANADMVGHTGNLPATIEAIETLDGCLRQVADSTARAGGCLLITADHGNAEQMFDDTTGQAHTAHTSQPVPLLFVGQGWSFQQKTGTLADIAPSILHLLQIQAPREMTGRNLLAARP